MIISHRHRFIFFHQPLTHAGHLHNYLETWNEEPIEQIHRRTPEHPFYRHMPPTAVKKAFENLGWDFSSYRRITCTSNPYVRLSALHTRINRHDPVWRMKSFIGLKTPNFDEWVKQLSHKTNSKDGTVSQHWRKMAAMPCDTWCANLMTDIIPTERLESELSTVLVQLKLPIPPNISDLLGEPEPLVPMKRETIDFIATRYARDIAVYGYDAPNSLT
ncbi:hypothetical protein BVC71_06845 [Marivivens niveibacter]|uniref:Sulfotransferase family protein n=1 Tax=Marivivens niveibacter TaxID=1930667 RepID=A0A251WYW6_9RHOB|nr:hypothetical protein [Marivivens niveibacter]OUD09562.1 hypothetical protein BVC71_06845 [Marivivens niveibacter]